VKASGYSRRSQQWFEGDSFGAQADVSALESEAQSDARVSAPQLQQGGQDGLEAAARQRAKTPGCVGGQEVM